MFNLVKLFTTPYLEVQWDNVVQQNLKPRYRGQTHARLPIRLFNLLKGLGSVQSKRVEGTWMTSVMDYCYLLDRLVDSPELRLKITETTTELSSEILGQVSEEMGIGLSVAVVTELFDVQTSTICKIKGLATKRPDWKCILKDNRTMVVEAKGSVNKYTSNQQLREAVRQKATLPANIKIASASLLNEDMVSTMRIVDPPVMDDNIPDEMKRHIFRANHYASVFSFLGEDVLSLYFEKMAKRLNGRIDGREMGDKNHMFHELNYNAPQIRHNNKDYSGHLYGPVENQYLFLGVDKRLLSYDGFMDFNDADEEDVEEKDGNIYYTHSDGILVINVVDSERFLEENHMESMGVNIDNIALNDIDSIKDSSFKRYAKYLIEKCGATTEIIDGGRVKASLGDKMQTYCFYHARNLKRYEPSDRALIRIEELLGDQSSILVTNLVISGDVFGVPTVDRTAFERIANDGADEVVIKEVFGL